MPITIAVCITYYNEGILLRECLKAIYANSRLPDEILVYDDASEDPAERYIEGFIGVKLIRSEVNRGPAYGRDKLIAETTCEFVHLHDCDDLLMSNWCERVFTVIQNENPDIILTDVQRISEVSGHTPPIFWMGHYVAENQHLCLYREIAARYIFPAVVTFRRQVALSIGGHRWREVIAMAEDVDFFVRLAMFTNNFHYINEKLVLKRDRESSYSQAHKLEHFEQLYHGSLLKSNLLLLNSPHHDLQAQVAILVRLYHLISMTRHSNDVLINKVIGNLRAIWPTLDRKAKSLILKNYSWKKQLLLHILGFHHAMLLKRTYVRRFRSITQTLVGK
jgi:glycosyltransferase involved in cell wall biosynthesis